jgi:hypothetical protein
LELRPNFLKSYENIEKNSLLAERVVYISAQYAEDFVEWLRQNPGIQFANWHLLLHNWDNIPSETKFLELAARFKTVGANHWHGPLNIAKPLPIGLENWDLQRNGIPRDFNRLQQKGLPKFEDRDIKILCSFTVATNRNERQQAWDFCQNLNDAFLMPAFTTPKKYRNLVTRSKFVISPPGNGADCHRTWEAIYLGAVPIVLSEYWGYSHWRLPVITVEKWSDTESAIAAFTPINFSPVEELKNLFLSKEFIQGKFSDN